MFPIKRRGAVARKVVVVGGRKRKTYRARRTKSRAYHGVKKFTCMFKLQDVDAAPYGTHPDGYTRNRISLRLADIPIFTNLWTLYKQFAITSVKLQYRPSVSVAFAGNTPTASVAQILYAEDKDSDGAIGPVQLQSEDNCKVFRSDRNWSTFIKMPRPNLYQNSGVADQLVRTIQSARQVQWLSPTEAGAGSVEANIQHLCAQMCVSDITGAPAEVGVGELWCKVYMSVKEQRKSGAV